MNAKASKNDVNLYKLSLNHSVIIRIILIQFWYIVTRDCIFLFSARNNYFRISTYLIVIIINGIFILLYALVIRAKSLLVFPLLIKHIFFYSCF